VPTETHYRVSGRSASRRSREEVKEGSIARSNNDEAGIVDNTDRCASIHEAYGPEQECLASKWVNLGETRIGQRQRGALRDNRLAVR
jgi:hypothetical protein